MSTDAKILFARYFGTLYPSEREIYRGKYIPDPDACGFGRLLFELRDAINQSLPDCTDPPKCWVPCGQIYFDYMDSEKSRDAIAFRYEDHSFIGITVPLMILLWDTSVTVSETVAPHFAQNLNLSIAPDALRVVLFRPILFFISTHEFTHHVHGHLLDKPFNFYLEGNLFLQGKRKPGNSGYGT